MPALRKTEFFEAQVRRLERRYARIRRDLAVFAASFSWEQGAQLGHRTFKFRVANSSIPTGKSGGFRVIAIQPADDASPIPVLVYAKSMKTNVSDLEIREAVAATLEELETA